MKRKNYTKNFEAKVGYVSVFSLEDDGKFCLHADKISRQVPYVAADILNSAWLLAPEVEYILPTFGWEQKSDNGEKKAD